MKKDSFYRCQPRNLDMNSLVKAREQTSAGAGVDVTDPELLPKGHPL
jgi:phosphoglycerate dehydrogenase-like enzyme